MIRSFRHKGLRRLFEDGDASGVPAHLVRKLVNVMAFLNVANAPEEAGPLPGLRLHRLKGDMKGTWSITISGNWRLVFRFADGDAHDVDFLDYH
jgi:proteic killer suppression protein